MRQALFYAPGDVRVEEAPVPQAGPGEVLVKVEVALVCGTDAKTFRRGHPLLLERVARALRARVLRGGGGGGRGGDRLRARGTG